MNDVTAITVDTYNTIAQPYSEKYFTDTSDFAHIESFISRIKPHGSVLEIGCGAGQFSQYLISKGFSVIGIDLSDAMLTLAKEHVPQGDFQTMDMRSLSFPDSMFDGVIAPYSLIHIPDAEVTETLKGFSRVLTSQGRICLIVQQGDADHMVTEPFAPDKQIFFNFFTPERIQAHVQEAGFTTIEIKTISCDDPYALGTEILYIDAKKA